MADTYASDNTFNVLEEHVIHALQADADLGTGGPLAVTTWEQEVKADAGQYADVELPVIAVSCETVTEGESEGVGVPEGMTLSFPVQIWWIDTAAEEKRRKQKAKESLARIVRVMLQQHLPSKQLKLSSGEKLPSSLDWADSGSVSVQLVSAAFDDGQINNVFRTVGLVEVVVSVDFQITGD